MKPASEEQGEMPQSVWSTLSYWDGNLLARWRRLAGKAGGTASETIWSSLADILEDKEVALVAEHWKPDEDDWWWVL